MERQPLGGEFDLPTPQPVERQTVEHLTQPRPIVPPEVPEHNRIGDARLLQRLQSQAGNRAVMALVQQARRPAADAAPRECKGKEAAAAAPVESTPMANGTGTKDESVSQERPPALVAVQRLMTTSQWRKRRPKRWKNAAHQKPIRALIQAYDKVRKKGRPSQKQRLLYDLLAAIDQWKRDDPDPAPDGHQLVDALRREVEQEIGQLVRAFSGVSRDERLKEFATGLARVVPPPVTTEPDLATRANQIFENYMAEFRGKVQYTLKTVPNIGIFAKSDLVACATISNGLRDALRYGGIADATTVQITHQKFITKPINPGTFIDSEAIGNVRRPGGAFEDEKRFFFTMHWIVSCPGAGVHFDPTSGIRVSANADEIVDLTLSGFQGGGLGTRGASYTSDSHVLKTLDEGTRHGGGYELSKKGP